jgi:hypothetical protein
MLGIAVSGCAIVGGIDLPDPSVRFAEAEREDAEATAPASLPDLPEVCLESCPAGQTVFTDEQMDRLMLFTEVAYANTDIGHLLSEELTEREKRINALIDMGIATEREAALYREGWKLEYETRLWEIWTLRIGLGVAVVGLILK